jgi:hypothetical protein
MPRVSTNSIAIATTVDGDQGSLLDNEGVYVMALPENAAAAN